MEKIKLYLDTNIIYTYFMQKAKELKSKRKVPLPKVFKFLRKNKDVLEFYVSKLTEIEILRKLVTELSLNESESAYLWDDFCNSLDCNLVKSEEINISLLWDFIRGIVIKIPIKKRVTNLEHLGIASQFNLTFLTGDKEVLVKCKRFYPMIMSYIDLRRNLKGETKDGYEKERKV